MSSLYSSKFWSLGSRKLERLAFLSKDDGISTSRGAARGIAVHKGTTSATEGPGRPSEDRLVPPTSKQSGMQTRRPLLTKTGRWTHTRMSFPPSWATRVLLPTISDGQTISSRIFSWTAVRVRERGRFCLLAAAEFRLGLGRTRRCERKMMYLSDSFFSSSRVSLWVGRRCVENGRALRRLGGEK